MITIPRFKISARAGGYDLIITASNARSAWRKFCVQRFGALKPDRRDYTVTRH